jgi:branched-chain amino acid transport system substrate-binding protein
MSSFSKKALTKLQATAIAVIVIIAIVAGVTYYLSLPKPPPSTATPIKIGFICDLTGELSYAGASQRVIAEAAVRYINEKGGINGRRVELYVEDGESSSTTATTKFRKLVEYWGVDFIIGPSGSGANVACCPLAKEYGIIFFVTAGATEITGEKGNRYVFRINRNNDIDAYACAIYGSRIAKKWTTIVLDYSAGIASEVAFVKKMTELGGTILKSIRVPSGTIDFMPYVKLIPPETEAVFCFIWPPATWVTFMKALRAVYPNIKAIGAAAIFSAVRIEELPPEAQGFAIATAFPFELEYLNTTYNREFRKICGINEHGRDVSNPKMVYGLTYDWSVWETIFTLKEAIEKSGWQSKKDNIKLIETLEGMELKESLFHPQGSKVIRAEDHQAFPKMFIEQLQGNKLVVVATIEPQQLIYPPPVDFRRGG